MRSGASLCALHVSSAHKTGSVTANQLGNRPRLDLLILVVRKETFHLDMTVT